MRVVSYVGFGAGGFTVDSRLLPGLAYFFRKAPVASPGNDRVRPCHSVFVDAGRGASSHAWAAPRSPGRRSLAEFALQRYGYAHIHELLIGGVAGDEDLRRETRRRDGIARVGSGRSSAGIGWRSFLVRGKLFEQGSGNTSCDEFTQPPAR